MDIEQMLKKNWTDASDSYSNIVNDEINSFLRNEWEKIILENIPERSGLDVLDVGTGPGFFAIIMSQLGNNVTAIDCTAAMIEQAKKNAEKNGVFPNFVVSDGQHTNFDDDSFDIIISRNVTWTLIDAEAAYMEWKRILKPDGKVIIFDANWNHRFFNDEYMKKYNDDLAEYERMFKKPAPRHTPEEEEYRKCMPMCARVRPKWDLDTLMKIGYKRIYCNDDISKRIWDNERQILNKSTPMFMICASK